MANPRFPSPSVPSISFPTPDLTDRVLVETHCHSKPFTGPNNAFEVANLPEYGVAHPDTVKYPDHRLSLIQPDQNFPEQGAWFKYFWINERANSDAFNYEIEYPVGIIEYPKVTRTYVLLTEGLEEPDGATSDPVYEDLVLTSHRQLRTGDPVTDSLFVVVQRSFEKMPGALLTYYFYDSTTDTTITETRQRVLYTTPEPTITDLFTDFQSVPESRIVKMFINRSYPADIVDKTIVEFRRERFVYPAIMTALVVNTLEKLDHTKIASVFPTIEAERPKTVPHKLTTTFTTDAPSESDAISGIYVLQPVRHTYDGVFFSVPTGPVLSNAVSLTYTTGSSDPIWGDGVVETYTKAASVPTATAYLASRSADEWKIIDREFKKLAKSLWMKTEIKIPIL